MTEIKKVTVLGTGVLGAQIAFQTAFKEFDVVAYDINDQALTAANERLAELERIYADEVSAASGGRAAEARERITLTSDLEAAASEADLVIEAVPEDLSIKNDTYAKINAFAPDHTIFATNSSTLLPSWPARFSIMASVIGVWMNAGETVLTSSPSLA